MLNWVKAPNVTTGQIAHKHQAKASMLCFIVFGDLAHSLAPYLLSLFLYYLLGKYYSLITHIPMWSIHRNRTHLPCPANFSALPDWSPSNYLHHPGLLLRVLWLLRPKLQSGNCQSQCMQSILLKLDFHEMCEVLLSLR